jgi:hypothetical protein
MMIFFYRLQNLFLIALGRVISLKSKLFPEFGFLRKFSTATIMIVQFEIFISENQCFGLDPAFLNVDQGPVSQINRTPFRIFLSDFSFSSEKYAS